MTKLGYLLKIIVMGFFISAAVGLVLFILANLEYALSH